MNLQDTSLFLFDIEGTTTPISFVHKVLFPYSSERFTTFLESNLLGEQTYLELEQEIQQDIQKKVYSGSPFQGRQNVETINQYLTFLVSIDRKSKPLKQIQGQIWQQGYESGSLTSELFTDVLPFFKKISQQKKHIAIYSSGSVAAQKLVFQYSAVGDLSTYISDYFDTSIGHKREQSSYQNISKAVATPVEKIVFFTDIKEEADAASACGISPIILDRPGNFAQAKHEFPVLTSFESIIL
ncbi:MAG: acireductone synthase [Spirochaetota bacterium]